MLATNQMKGTKDISRMVHGWLLGPLIRMRNANWWAGPRNADRIDVLATSHRLAAWSWVGRFTAALDLDTYPLRNLIRPRCAERAKPGRGKPVLIMHIGFLACFHAISLERSRFSKNCHVIFPALVALKLLVSLISRLVARSARIDADKQTDRQTDRLHTERLL